MKTNYKIEVEKLIVKINENTTCPYTVYIEEHNKCVGFVNGPDTPCFYSFKNYFQLYHFLRGFEKAVYILGPF